MEQIRKNITLRRTLDIQEGFQLVPDCARSSKYMDRPCCLVTFYLDVIRSGSNYADHETSNEVSTPHPRVQPVIKND